MKGSNLRAAAFALVSVAFAATVRADTRAWDGGGADNKWSTAENWSDDTVPAADDVALFDDTSSKDATIDTDVIVDVVEIKPGYAGTITQAAGVTITVGGEWKQDGGAFAGSDGTITINGPLTLKGGSFAGGTGTMTVQGEFRLEETGSFDAGSINLAIDGPLTLTNGTFSGGSASVTVAGVFKQDGGTLGAGGATIRLESHLTLAGGTFNAGTSTFTFIGSAEQVADFTDTKTFANVAVEKTSGVLRFVKKGFSADVMSISPGDTVEFTSQGTTTLGEMEFYGRPDELIVLRSIGGGNQWDLVAPSDQKVCYVDVRDSDASGGAQVTAYNSTDSGNNLNWVFAGDHESPVAAVISPEAGTWTNDPRPEIAASLTDDLSGIDPDTVTVATVPASDGTVSFDPDASRATFTLHQDLPEGDITVLLDAADRAGNPVHLEWSFGVDVTPPVASEPSPAHESWTNNTMPEISASLVDELSGVDPAEIVMTVNGAEVENPGFVEGRVTHTPGVALPEGEVAVSVTASDAAGNAMLEPFVWKFGVDTSPADVSRVSPPAFVKEVRPLISVTVSDALAGVDESSFAMKLNGGTIGTGPGGYSSSPGYDLAEGEHTVSIEVTDNAGNSLPVPKTFTFTVDLTPPEVEVISPADGAACKSLRPTISATVTDAGSGLADAPVKLVLDGEVVLEGPVGAGALLTWTPGADLAEGEYEVAVIAEDAAGNSTAGVPEASWSFYVVGEEINVGPDGLDTAGAAIDAIAAATGGEPFQDEWVMILPAGTYAEAVTIGDGVAPTAEYPLTIRADGEAVFDGGGGLTSAFVIGADNVHLEGITVQGYTGSGVVCDGAAGFTASGVTSLSNGAWGIWVSSPDAEVVGCRTGGNGTGGIYVLSTAAQTVYLGQCGVSEVDVGVVVQAEGDASAEIVNNTVVVSAGDALVIGPQAEHGYVMLRNNILCAGRFPLYFDKTFGTDYAADLKTFLDLDSDYNDLFPTDAGTDAVGWLGGSCGLDDWQTNTLLEQHSLSAEPHVADPAGGDFHLRSFGGRYDPAVNDWVTDALGLHSPCIDAGTPPDVTPVGQELAPNGGRINMGAHGGTAEASKSLVALRTVDVAHAPGLQTTESGGMATFEVVLTAAPTAAVEIGLSSSDTTEGTVGPSSLTFTGADWGTPQTVTVTGVDDFVDDGNVTCTIITSRVSSADPGYNGLAVADVSVANIDDDTAGFIVTPTVGLITTEAGGTAAFTVALASQPTADVTIGLSSSDTMEGTASPALLTFTETNWDLPQTVTVTGVDDAEVDGDVAYTVTLGAASSSDANYDGLEAPDVSVTNTDDEMQIAHDDWETTWKDTPVTIDVVANDSCLGGWLSVVDVADALHGTVVDNRDGTVTYTPEANWRGLDSLDYTIHDDSGITDTATVTVFVGPVEVHSSDAASGDEFGYSVAADSDTVVVGAPGDSNERGLQAGSAYVFTRSGDLWPQTAKLTASDGTDMDWFGRSVAASHDIVVGAPFALLNQGAAYVFSKDGAAWTEESILAPDIYRGSGMSRSVAISGDTIVMAAPTLSGKGYACVFVWNGLAWEEQQRLWVYDETGFCHSVALSGDTFVAGAYGETYAGYACVFVRNGETWTQQAKLTAADGEPYDFFAADSVGICGNTIVVGALGDDDVGDGAGAAYVFVRNGGAWTQQAKLVAPDGGSSDQFGESVHIWEDVIVVGAALSDAKSPGSGSAYLFMRSGDSWVLRTKLSAPDGKEADYFGESVAVSDRNVVVGARLTDDNGEASGSAYIFRFGHVVDAVDDTASCEENDSVTVDVLDNDMLALSVVDVRDGSHGDVVDNGDGIVTYTPDPGFSGSDSFTYTAGDGWGGMDTATVTVTVVPSLPRVLSADPGDAIDVPLSTAITVTFSKSMNTAAVGTASSLAYVGPGAYSEGTLESLGDAAWNADNTIMTFTPQSEFLSASMYVVKVKGEDASGYALEPYYFGFTTLGPSVLSMSPSDGEVQVPVSADIVVTFSESMNTSAVETASLLGYRPPGSDVVSMWSLESIGDTVWDAENTAMIFTPHNELLTDTTYLVEMHGESVSGSPLAAYNSSFTTVDTIAPVITRVDSQVDDDTDESYFLSSTITITVAAQDDETGLTGWVEISSEGLGYPTSLTLNDENDGTYTCVWDTRAFGGVPPGSDYAVEARLQDAGGNEDADGSNPLGPDLVIRLVARKHVITVGPDGTGVDYDFALIQNAVNELPSGDFDRTYEIRIDSGKTYTEEVVLPFTIHPSRYLRLVLVAATPEGDPPEGEVTLDGQDHALEWGIAGNASHVTLKGLTIQNYARWGVFNVGASDIEDCTVQYCGSLPGTGRPEGGFLLLSSGTVTRCAARNNTGNGFSFVGEWQFVDCEASSNSWCGFFSDDASMPVLRGCFDSGNDDKGIDITVRYTGLIEDHTSWDNTVCGIRILVMGASPAVVRNSVVYGASGTGLDVAFVGGSCHLINNTVLIADGVAAQIEVSSGNLAYLANNILAAGQTDPTACQFIYGPVDEVYADSNNFWDPSGGAFRIHRLPGPGWPAIIYSDPAEMPNNRDSMSTDPLFANTDPIAGNLDFHLRSRAGRYEPAADADGFVYTDSETSPCIDAGKTDGLLFGPDYRKEPWPNGGRINMGAYGGTEEASRSETPPTVVGTVPVGSAEQVAITAVVDISFSEEMDAITESSASIVDSATPPQPVSGSWALVGSLLRFTPASDLDYDTTYTVTVDAGIAEDTEDYTLDGDGDGIPEGSPDDDYSFSFTTHEDGEWPAGVPTPPPGASPLDVTIVTGLEPPKYYTNEESIAVTVKVSGGSGAYTVTMTGAETATNAGSMASFTVPLPVEGPYTLEATVYDTPDGYGYASLEIIVDRTPPVIRVTKPFRHTSGLCGVLFIGTQNRELVDANTPERLHPYRRNVIGQDTPWIGLVEDEHSGLKSFVVKRGWDWPYPELVRYEPDGEVHTYTFSNLEVVTDDIKDTEHDDVYAVLFEAEDRAGNPGSFEIRIDLDRTPPKVFPSTGWNDRGGTEGPLESVGTLDYTVAVELGPSPDALTSLHLAGRTSQGPLSFGGEWWVPPGVVERAEDSAAGGNTYTIHYLAEDYVGNTATATFEHKVVPWQDQDWFLVGDMEWWYPGSDDCHKEYQWLSHPNMDPPFATILYNEQHIRPLARGPYQVDGGSEWAEQEAKTLYEWTGSGWNLQYSVRYIGGIGLSGAQWSRDPDEPILFHVPNTALFDGDGIWKDEAPFDTVAIEGVFPYLQDFAGPLPAPGMLDYLKRSHYKAWFGPRFGYDGVDKDIESSWPQHFPGFFPITYCYYAGYFGSDYSFEEVGLPVVGKPDVPSTPFTPFSIPVLKTWKMDNGKPHNAPGYWMAAFGWALGHATTFYPPSSISFNRDEDQDNETVRANISIPRVINVLQLSQDTILAGELTKVFIRGGFPKDAVVNEGDIEITPSGDNTNPALAVIWGDEPGMVGEGPGLVEENPMEATIWRSIELYIDAPEDALGFYDVKVTCKNTDGEGVDGYVMDKVLNVLKMEYVMPGEPGEEEIEYTDRLVVCDPRPTVTLGEFSEYDFRVTGLSVNLTLGGYVEDPIADNLPEGKVTEGGADIDSVQVYVDGLPVGAAQPVYRVAAGASSFWKQHPYKGTFDPVTVSLPVSGGTHTIRVQTSENAAGNVGYDEVTVDFLQQVLPGGTVGGGTTVTANVYLPVDPTPEVADTIQYYYGERNPLPRDAVLSEAGEEPDSLVFSGTFDGTTTTISVADFVGDTFTGTIRYSYPDGHEAILVVAFTETGPNTSLYRGTFTIGGGGAGQPQTVWMGRVANGAGSSSGTYVPMNVQVKVTDDIADYTVAFEDVAIECDLAEHNGYYYLKGGSITHIVVTRSKVVPANYVIILWDKATARPQKKVFRKTALDAALKRIRRTVAWRRASFLWVDLDFTTWFKRQRTDNRITPETTDDVIFIYPSHFDCFIQPTAGAAFTPRCFLRYQLSTPCKGAFKVGATTHQVVQSIKVRVIPHSQPVSKTQFETDEAAVVQSAGTDPNFTPQAWREVFNGITSAYTEGGQTKMSVDADGEPNGLATTGATTSKSFTGTWKFIDPKYNTNLRAQFDAEIEVKVRLPIQPRGGPPIGKKDYVLRDVETFEARVRHVGLFEDGSSDVQQWWGSKGIRIPSLPMPTVTGDDDPETPGNCLVFKQLRHGAAGVGHNMGFRWAYRALTPRGQFCYGYHGNIESSPPGTPNRVPDLGQANQYGNDATDLYGVIYLPQDAAPDTGMMADHAGFCGNGLSATASRTIVNAHPTDPVAAPGFPAAVPYDLRDIPRAHKVSVYLVTCWSGHNSDWDDSGNAVAGTLWDVLNRGCSSATVGGSWGFAGAMLGIATQFNYRPIGDDEGATDALGNRIVAEDRDTDPHASTWYHDAQQGDDPNTGNNPNHSDAAKNNWIEQQPRPKVAP